MSENSKIEWTDHTFNPWIGCTKIDPGCANCYADAQDKFRKWTPEGWGKGKPRRRTSAANWRKPLQWDMTKICTNCGSAAPITALVCQQRGCAHFEFRRPRVFSASLADWLDDEVPIEVFADFLKLIFETRNLQWLLLTKRPENWKRRMLEAHNYLFVHHVPVIPGWCYRISHWLGRGLDGVQPPANVSIGASVCDQAGADKRIKAVLAIPAKVHFLSCEPLLEAVDLAGYLPWRGEHQSKGLPSVLGRALRSLTDVDGIDWVICGGESGGNARPMHPNWARSLRVQCEMAGVAFFFKRWGEWAPVKPDDAMLRVGKKAAGRMLDGREWSEFPNWEGSK